MIRDPKRSNTLDPGQGSEARSVFQTQSMPCQSIVILEQHFDTNNDPIMRGICADAGESRGELCATRPVQVAPAETLGEEMLHWLESKPASAPIHCCVATLLNDERLGGVRCGSKPYTQRDELDVLGASTVGGLRQLFRARRAPTQI